MTDEELLLATLCDAWRQALIQLGKARDVRSRDYWAGVMNGLACSIAAVSGIPDTIRFMDAIRAGTDIARARPPRR